MQTGAFTNAANTYFAAPQQLNAAGQVIGHNHVVIETIASLDSTEPTNPKVFAFFKGLNDVAANGQLSADLTKGLPAGTYRMSSITSAANHQSVVMPIAQRGSVDDAIYVGSFPGPLLQRFLTPNCISSSPSVETLAALTTGTTPAMAMILVTVTTLAMAITPTVATTATVRTVVTTDRTTTSAVATFGAPFVATRGASSDGTSSLNVKPGKSPAPCRSCLFYRFLVAITDTVLPDGTPFLFLAL